MRMRERRRGRIGGGEGERKRRMREYGGDAKSRDASGAGPERE
jgi:hypothetical protein